MIFSILLPTRGREDKILPFINTVFNTADNPENVEIIIRIDDDDPAILSSNKFKYVEGTINMKGLTITFIRGPRLESLSDNWNECFRNCTGEIAMLAGDDLAFRTPSWDVEIKKEFDKFPDGILLLYCLDGPRKTMTHPFIHRNWVETLGYFTPPGFDYANDSWLEDLARKTGRIVFREDIYIEHEHWAFGKRQQDRTDQDLIRKYSEFGGREKFKSMESLRDWDVEKLKKVMR